jgi:hypothetical protein
MAEGEAAKNVRIRFEGVCPIFRVQNVAASVEYYVQRLGFQMDWQAPYIVSVSRGSCHIFLSEGDQGHPGAWAWVGVEDAMILLAEYQASGAKVRHPPTNYDWALEMQVEDLDGNILRLGSEPLEDQPIGEWLDMHGQRWVYADGNWVRSK